MHKLGLGVADRTLVHAERSSLHYLFWRLPRKRTWTRSGSKRYLDESWVLIVKQLFCYILAWHIIYYNIYTHIYIPIHLYCFVYINYLLLSASAICVLIFLIFVVICYRT